MTADPSTETATREPWCGHPQPRSFDLLMLMLPVALLILVMVLS